MQSTASNLSPRGARALQRAGLLAALLVSPFAASGCGPNCQSTCDRLFSVDECGIQRNEKSPEEVRNDCLASCDEALANPGPLGDYNPDERKSGSQTVKLETDQQAAAWMECVEETSCSYLEDGYCAPVWF